MPYWPSDLPVYPLLDSLQYAPPNTLLSSPSDIGPPQVRRRTTAGVARARLCYVLTEAQFVTFQDFLDSETAGGALSFVHLHPLTEQQVSMRFDPEALPSYTPLGKGRWKVEFEVLILP